MVSKKEQLKFINRLYDNEKERIYYQYNVVNIKKVQSREDDLINLKEYLPNLLRSFITTEYYTRMEEYGVIDKVLKKMRKTRGQSREDNVIEYINWIDSHKEFNDLLNEKQVKKLGDSLEELEKEVKELKKII